MNILSIIPARSGSIGVKDKNITVINNLTLIEHAVIHALKYSESADIVVSTDSNLYLNKVKNLLGHSSKLRPKYLSKSSSKITDVIKYEINKITEINPKKKFDLILLLEPSHFSNRKNIPKAIKLMNTKDLDYCIGVASVPEKYNYKKQLVTSSDRGNISIFNDSMNRQELAPAFIRSGEFYLFKLKNFLKTGQILFGKGELLITNEKFVNIDTEEDLMDLKRKFD